MNRSSEENDINIMIGNIIKTTRQVEGMSRSTLAEEIGYSQQQIAKYEEGSNRISASKLLIIARTLEKPISHFYDSDNIYKTNGRLSLMASQNFARIKNRELAVSINNLLNSILKIEN